MAFLSRSRAISYSGLAALPNSSLRYQARSSAPWYLRDWACEILAYRLCVELGL